MTQICVVSDFHIGKSDDRPDMDRFVDSIEESDPHSLFVLGDCIHESGETGTDIENLEWLVDQLGAGDFQTYFLGGNHDANAFGRGLFEAITGTEQNQLIDTPTGVKIAVVDSAFGAGRYENIGYLGDEAIELLTDAGRNAIVMTHFPLTYTDEYQDNMFFSENPEAVFPIDKYRFEQLEQRPSTVVCGHLHVDDGIRWSWNDVQSRSISPYTQFDDGRESYYLGSYKTINIESMVGIDKND